MTKCIASRWRVAELQFLDRLLGQPAVSQQVLANARAGGRLKLLAKMRDRDFVDLDERFPFRRRLSLFATGFEIGNGNAESLREIADGLLEADLFLQLHELEHVAADTAAEAVEEALVLVDGKGRGLLAVEGAQALVSAAGPAQRDRVRDDGDNVRRRAYFVDERLGKEGHSELRLTLSAYRVRPTVAIGFAPQLRGGVGAPGNRNR